MKASLHLTAAALLITSSAFAETDTSTAPSTAPSTDVEQAKALIKQFATTLQGELEAAMKEGGPTNAIGVCKDRAPAIASDLSEQSGWKVGRTSLKLRHPELNSPDAWETQVLEDFQARANAGEDLTTMAYSEVVETPDGEAFRFMKAIPAGAPCMKCHGAEITDEVAAALDEQYPNDQARGFAVGDLRGAFTLVKPAQ